MSFDLHGFTGKISDLQTGTPDNHAAGSGLYANQGIRIKEDIPIILHIYDAAADEAYQDISIYHVPGEPQRRSLLHLYFSLHVLAPPLMVLFKYMWNAKENTLKKAELSRLSENILH